MSSFRKSFSDIKKSLSEEAPANSVAAGGVSGLTGIPPVPANTKYPMLRRKKQKSVTEDSVLKKAVNAAKRANKKTKFPMDRWRDARDNIHDPSKPWNPARGKAARKAYDLFAKKGYYPNFGEESDAYVMHVKGKKLPKKAKELKGVNEMKPGDEYPRHPVLSEEVEDYVVAFTLPVFVRTLEIAREKIKSDDELHVFVEHLVNLQGEDVLTMDDVMDVFEKYRSD